VVGIAMAAMLGLAGCHPMQTRDDFKSAVMNKSPEEVQQALGKPDTVDESDPSRLVWIYNEATFNIANNNKRDPKARVIFSRQASKPSVVEVDFGS
jgi:hypothetical protein